MSNEQSRVPKVFISYSWTSPQHEQRVIAWAERLVSDGIDVILDKWNLQAGQDKYAFMEKMVTDATVSKVLVFSDKGYADKADARKGGVGTESQIISKEIYEKVDQNKFLPVVFEMDEKGQPHLPTFFKTRIYFDFSSPEASNESYERLVRAIYDKPLHKKPALGKPPEFILKDTAPALWSRPILANFKDALLQGKPYSNGYAKQFLDTFHERLEDFRIVYKEGVHFDDEVVQSIESFLPFRDNFIEFVNTVITWGGGREAYEQTADFFERSICYLYRPKTLERFNEAWWDNYRFILYELFLYVIATLLKNRRFEEIGVFADKLYYLPDNADPGPNPFVRYTIFRNHCRTLDERNQRLKLNRLSVLADLMHQRASLKSIPFNDVMQAEAFLLLKSMVTPDFGRPWYPDTLIYARYTKSFELFARAASHKQFEVLRRMLDVESKDDLIERLRKAFEKHRVGQWYHFGYESVSFEHLWNLEKLDTLP